MSKDWLLVISILLLLSSMVTAYDIAFTVLNYITLNPVENANVSIINGSVIYDSLLSDSNGDGVLSAMTEGVQTLFTHRLSYNDRTESLSVTTDTHRIIYLTSNTAEGIIRVSTNDLTFSNREFCVYFEDNNRLVDCYDLNDTFFQIIVDTNYTIKPKLTTMDLVSIDQIDTVADLYTDKIGGLIIIVLLLMVIAYACFKKN